jgi:hypothetical protein
MAATMPATAASSVTSASIARAVPPSASISRTASSASSRDVFAFTTMVAPWRASASAMARPIRLTPPVTRAT